MEDTKQKQEELNKLLNEFKKSNRNIKNDPKRDNQGTHFNSSKLISIRKNPLSKEKIQTKQKTLINEPIPLSNRFNPMDVEDPVETIIEDSDETTTHMKTDSDETTTHIKTDTIKLQKRLHKKKLPKTTQQKRRQQILPKK